MTIIMVAIRHIWNQHILGLMRHLEAAQRSHTSCEMNACSSYDISCQGQRLNSLIWQIILTVTWGNHLRYCFVVSEKKLDLSFGQWNELINTTWGNIWGEMNNWADWEWSNTYIQYDLSLNHNNSDLLTCPWCWCSMEMRQNKNNIFISLKS